LQLVGLVFNVGTQRLCGAYLVDLGFDLKLHLMACGAYVAPATEETRGT
jgi:hypothetical protein